MSHERMAPTAHDFTSDKFSVYAHFRFVLEIILNLFCETQMTYPGYQTRSKRRETLSCFLLERESGTQGTDDPSAPRNSLFFPKLRFSDEMVTSQISLNSRTGRQPRQS